MDADVAVIGVGSMGSMAAWQLARRGASVIGFEQFAPGHDRSGAGGESRIFRTAYHEGGRYVPLLLAAQEEWRRLERETGRHLLTLNGGLMIGDPQSDFIANVRASVEEHGLPHQVLEHDDAARRYPQHRLLPGEVMILDELAGFLRPELCVALASLRAEELGARILRRARVTAVEPEGDGVTVRTAERTWRVATAVVAAGPWADALLAGHAAPLRVQRLVMTWFLAREPDSFSVARFPIFIRRTQTHRFSGWPSLDGHSVKVALSSGYDEVEDPDHLDRSVDDARLGTIRAAVAELLPGLIPDPVRVGAYMDGYTEDHQPAVGVAPGLPNTILLHGFSGHGFKLASVMGRIAAELAIDGGTALPIEHLAPSRLSAAAT